MTRIDPQNQERRRQLAELEGGLIVSCQARAGNPLHGPESMALMAQAAELGGASGLRVNGVDDIQAALQVTSIPILGINKVEYDDSPVMITSCQRKRMNA